jgi:hypothetical protein
MTDLGQRARDLIAWYDTESDRINGAVIAGLERVLGLFFARNPQVRSVFWVNGLNDRLLDEGVMNFAVTDIAFLDRKFRYVEGPTSGCSGESSVEQSPDPGCLNWWELEDFGSGDRKLGFNISAEDAEVVVELLRSEQVGSALQKFYDTVVAVPLSQFKSVNIRATPGDAGAEDSVPSAILSIAAT